MNEEVNVQKISSEISDIILRLSIEAQNEVFATVRRNLIDTRKQYIQNETSNINDHQARTDFALKTLETVFMSSFDQPKCPAR